jgi:hypothetical protein
VPGWANVQLPLQLVLPSLTGTPLQLGVSGPLFQTTPCGTTALAFLNETAPPGAIVADEGRQ